MAGLGSTGTALAALGGATATLGGAAWLSGGTWACCSHLTLKQKVFQLLHWVNFSEAVFSQFFSSTKGFKAWVGHCNLDGCCQFGFRRLTKVGIKFLFTWPKIWWCHDGRAPSITTTLLIIRHLAHQPEIPFKKHSLAAATIQTFKEWLDACSEAVSRLVVPS